jgi:hypothetical protein
VPVLPTTSSSRIGRPRAGHEKTTPHDVAWSKAYGLHPATSDAWDHSIEALESIVKPRVVEPNNPTATLGHIVREMSRLGTTVGIGAVGLSPGIV